ncbi:MAG: hypothetical protein J6Y93_02965 [Treponema sp.]|nr:hypothetical protein [Treponema sp.]
MSVRVYNPVQVFVSHSRNAQIKNGNVVRGHILSANADATYTVRLAGQKFNAASQTKLVPGQFFEARIDVRDNKVFLSLISEKTAEATASFYPSDLESAEPPRQLVNYLASLGLPPESTALRLVQFMQESGFKFAPGKIRNILKERHENDRDADEKNQTALLLSEKGLPFTGEYVSEIIYNSQEHGHKKENEQDDFSGAGNNGVMDDYFSSVRKACDRNREGLLTLFNTMSEGERHWVVLPFEWDYKSFNGVIRVLYDKTAERTDKIVISCNNDLKKYSFVIELDNDRVRRLTFSSVPSLLPEMQETFASVLEGILREKLHSESVYVSYCDSSLLEGFAPENVPLTVVKEEA